MENWERELKSEVLKKAQGLEDFFEKAIGGAESFEKAGKTAQIGEVRMWHGVQMKKVSATGNSKQDWQPVKQGEKSPDSEKAPEDKKKLKPEELAGHAKESSESALEEAVKKSPDPAVRQAAHAELDRRGKEEKPTEGKASDGEKEKLKVSTAYGDMVYSSIDNVKSAVTHLKKPENYTVLKTKEGKFILTTNKRASRFVKQGDGENHAFVLPASPKGFDRKASLHILKSVQGIRYF